MMMADGGDEEQQLQAVMAEPEECSRWAMTCLVGCVGAGVLCLSMYLIGEFHLLGLLLLYLGLAILAYSLACVFERFIDGNPLGYPLQGLSLVDTLLSL